MTLVRVEYEFFDFEEPSSTASGFARQIRLHFSDAPTVYVSWSWERQRGPDSANLTHLAEVLIIQVGLLRHSQFSTPQIALIPRTSAFLTINSDSLRAPVANTRMR